MTWDEVAVQTQLPEVVDQISYERVVMNAGTTWDYVPWHYNPEYAKDHGHPTIFVNTMHLAGFVDRIATDFGGPYSRVVRRKLVLLGSIYAGDSMVARSRVIGKRIDTSGDGPRYLVDLELGIFNQRDELCCPAEVTLEVPATCPR
jgi:acyl dehydratase